MKPAPFEFTQARDPAHAVTLLAATEGMGKLCSGTQSLGPMLNLRLAQPSSLIDVSRVPELRTASIQGDVLRLGAAVTHARIEDGDVPDVTLGLLPKVAAGIAYRAVRNRGTLGGSLAHADPSADWVTTMTLLDAGLVLKGIDGERTVHASDFFVGPFTTALAEDEMIVAIDVPRFSSSARWAYEKTCRKPGEFAEAIAGAWIDEPRGVFRVAIGALDGMPHVTSGKAAIDELRTHSGVASMLDAASVEGAYERQLLTAMLRRALSRLDTFKP